MKMKMEEGSTVSNSVEVMYMNGDGTTIGEVLSAPRVLSQLWDGGRALVIGKDEDGHWLWTRQYTQVVRIAQTKVRVKE